MFIEMTGASYGPIRLRTQRDDKNLETINAS